MGLKIIDFTIEATASNLEALRKIDDNKKGFLIVIEKRDEKLYLLGTLTDGDLRRAFIAGKSSKDSIDDEYRKDCKTLKSSDKFQIAVELFKSSAIEFLPVIEEDNQLINIITKKQMHALLLTDKRVDLAYDFMCLDEGLVDYEIFPRPWGFYKTTVMNDYFQSKVITVYPGGSLSLQSHNHREEHWIVAHGVGTVQIGESIIYVSCGSSLFIPKGCKHRLMNTGDKENLLLIEVQIGDYFGEDDIIRYEDIYGRV